MELQHSTIETNGIFLHVVTAGNPHGQPVILLHGFPEFWFSWRHQLPALEASGFQVIVPDQRGYNLSAKPEGIEHYRIETLAADILGLADHFACEQVSLVGHDWGAAVAWYLAIKQPARVRRLVIMNVPHPYIMMEFLSHSLRQVLKSWYIGLFQIPILPERLLSMGNYAAMARLLTANAKRSTFSKEDISEYKKSWSQPGAVTAMLAWYRAAFRERSALKLKERVSIPTLILWGRRDAALLSKMAERSLNWCDEGRLFFFDEATHWVQHDESDSVNLHLLKFLSEG